MKFLKTFIFLSLVLTWSQINSQTLSPRAQERENNEVEILTMEERSEIQIWFNQEVEKMKLNQDTREAYEAFYLLYTSKMMRLDDKDQDYTKEEIMKEMETLIAKMNKRMRDILPDKAFDMHIENTNTLFGYVKLKMAGY